MQINSSHNKTYLSATNNRYEKPHEIATDPEILADIRRRNDKLRERRPPRHSGPGLLRNIRHIASSASAASEIRNIEVKEDTMATIKEPIDVTAFPESSDEEVEVQLAPSKPSTLPTPEKPQTHKNKRALAETGGNTTASRRSKRMKTDTQEEQQPASEPLQTSHGNKIPGSQGSDMFVSQSSQKKRIKYGNQNKSGSYRPASTPECPEANKETGLSIPPAIASTPVSRASRKGTDRLELPTSLSSPVSPVKLFLPTFDEIQLDANTGIEDDVDEHFKRERRGSSSSLSSADSLASIQLDKKTKHRLNTDQDSEKPASGIPTGHVRCSRCKRITLKQGLAILKGKKDVNKLSHKDSQAFCYEHRMRDARQTWKNSHYPDSDLDTLTSPSRIATYLGNLIPIIQRKRKSFYMGKLDQAITNAKGNQGKVNRFFTIDAVAQTHNGYCGPSGAKRLALAIAADDKITKHFRRVEKSDKAFRTANLARAIDSILLPELLIMLVQDDLYLAHDEDGEAQARKILEDSEEVGIMLHGDDDDEVDETKENDDMV